MPVAKPAGLKALEGNRGKRRVQKEPGFSAITRVEVPDPPAFLGDLAASEWMRVAPEMVANRLITQRADVASLASYCTAYERWRLAESALQQQQNEPFGGYITETEKGNWIQSPLVGVARRAMLDMIKIMSELGMTPVSRARIGLHSGESIKPSKLRELIGG
jgi:P27 family predicted phage terminase small subunit